MEKVELRFQVGLNFDAKQVYENIISALRSIWMA